MSKSQGRHLLTEKDFVDVVDEEGEVVGSVPKHWDDDLDLAPGLKKKSGGRRGRASDQSSGSDGGSTPPPVKPEDEPAGNASTEDWAAYARTAKGAEDADLVNEQGEPLTRDELRAKFGTPAS